MVIWKPVKLQKYKRYFYFSNCRPASDRLFIECGQGTARNPKIPSRTETLSAPAIRIDPMKKHPMRNITAIADALGLSLPPTRRPSQQPILWRSSSPRRRRSTAKIRRTPITKPASPRWTRRPTSARSPSWPPKRRSTAKIQGTPITKLAGPRWTRSNWKDPDRDIRVLRTAGSKIRPFHFYREMLTCSA